MIKVFGVTLSKGRFIFLVLSAFLLISIPVAIYVARTRQEIRKEAADYFTFTPEAVSANNIYFDPSYTFLTGETPVKIMANTPANNISFARVVFTFDPAKVQLASEITPAASMSTTVEKTPLSGANTNGRAILVIASSPNDTAATGNFELAQFSIVPAQGAANDPTTINFDTPDMQLVDKSGVVIVLNPGSLFINSTAGSETPAPTDGIVSPPAGEFPTDIPANPEVSNYQTFPTTMPNTGNVGNKDQNGKDNLGKFNGFVKKRIGDYNNDGKINFRDFGDWFSSFFKWRFSWFKRAVNK